MADVVARLLDAERTRGWRISAGNPWYSARPVDQPARSEGWQLHLSATPASAPTMLARVAPVLAAHRGEFAFAPSVDVVRWLGGPGCAEVEFGRVLTVLPVDEAEFTWLAHVLHAVTTGLAGPRIPSARRYRTDSLVHVGYGGFGGYAGLGGHVLEPDQPVALDLDGRALRPLAPDRPPCPLDRPARTPTAAPRFATARTGTARTGAMVAGPAAGGAATNDGDAGPVRLRGRFVVRQTLRERVPTVYLATDESTGSEPAEVVVRHARAHSDVDVAGTDARGRLLHEARMLVHLAGRIAVPRPLDVFAVDGDLFLVQQRLVGQPLRRWVRGRSGSGSAPSAGPALAMARRLVDLVASAHAAGVVLRDLDPAHILIRADGRPALVSVAATTPLGQRVPAYGGGGRQSYLAPELRVAGGEPTVASAAEDLYGLGALLFLLATGTDPVLPADGPTDTRPDRDRLLAWLGLVARYHEPARTLAQASGMLLSERPGDRGDLAQVSRLLAVGRAAAPPSHASDQPTGDELLADGLDHLAATMRPDDAHLWEPSGPGVRTDARNVQHGAAGVLAVLVRALAHAGACDAHVVPVAVDAAARKAASWLSARAERGAEVLPGLYFGRAGAAWALADAAAILGEPQLRAQAERIALSLPVSWPNPDVAHGLAGTMLTQLHLAQTEWGAQYDLAQSPWSGPSQWSGPNQWTGPNQWSGPNQWTGPHHYWTGTSPWADRERRPLDARFLERAADCAEALRRAARAGPYGPTWPIPPGLPSRLAGAHHYGFAHGVAGIGYALLAAGAALGDSALTDLAKDAGYTLCRAARSDTDGAAWWPVGPENLTRLAHWCSGSSGVGTFLLRLFAATGEQRFAEYARAAAGAVHRSRWASPPSACHGLAGDGEFLLDAADVLSDPTYRAWAEDLVPLLAVRHCRRGGLALLPDETSRHVVADYNTGSSGVLAYLLRLRYGGSRLFLVDALLAEDGVNPAPPVAALW